ncbi:unnamed protein product [Psylliodes chrysocephalus]|uniref:Uncharacterized protein n=1 Tax=Psylliodes chrysocephalus TaxID=3402493 RepID=A0A9P0D4F5_9CUCU|nr:unnamed protein product [Psylliodes chrysocephala]
MKLNKICRTCLLEKANLKPLFEACVPNMLMSCASIQVIQGDGLPNQICTQCLQNVNRSYTFKQLCEKSDMELRNYLNISLQTISLPTDNIMNEVKSDLFNTSEVLQQSSLFQDIFNDATTHSFVETFTNQNTSTDLAETMQSLQTIAEQCLPDSWESDANIVPCNSNEATDNFNLGPIYKCQFCENIFKDEWSLSDHIKNHTVQNKFFCNICDKICDDSNELNKHILEHTFVNDKSHLNHPHTKVSKNLRCHICFTETRCLKKHLKEIHFIETVHGIDVEKKFGCNICGKRYRQNKLLSVHMRIHTGERPLSCDICGRTFALSSSLHKHKNIHNGEKKYECNICNKKFSQSSHLNVHIRNHTGQNKPHICNICGKNFTMNSKLVAHMRIHTGIKQYTCDFCKMSFATNSQLKKHSMIHTGEKPYPCWQCGRSFRRKETRDTHLRYHTGERPYTCAICSKKYVAASHLRGHMKTHSNDRKHECMICLQKFFDSKTLKNHLHTHSGQKPYRCHFCSKEFSQNGSLLTHIKNFHSQ